MYQTEKEKNCETCIHTGLCKFEKAYCEIKKDIIERAEQSTRFKKYGDITVEIKCNNFKEDLNRINYAPYRNSNTTTMKSSVIGAANALETRN